MQVNMLEAKTQLSKLVEAALRGEEVVIANRGKPVVKLVRAEPPVIRRVAGAWEGLMTEAQLDHAFSRDGARLAREPAAPDRGRAQTQAPQAVRSSVREGS